MPNTTAASFAFLSWVRQGLAAVSEGDRLPIRLRVTGNTTREFPVPARLYGPGDVIGLDPREVVRTEPLALSTDAEPNYFPLIEFDHPGLPWMFSPEAPDTAERLHPWLCLATVPRDACEDASCLGPGVPLPVLTCPAAELPNSAEGWAWAHAQVAYIGTDNDLESPLRDPVRSVSRLLSPRRLDAQTSYYACLVPVYEVGRKAGLGEPITPEDEETLRYAWESDASTVRLPVYYHWEFRTGEREDFEALATRIEARSLPDTLGQRPLDINEPGWTLELPPSTWEPVLGLEGALRTRDAVSTPWPAEKRTTFQGELRRILNAPADQASAEGAEAPIVTPPIYGQWYPGVTRVPEELGEPRWLADLNLDPRHRVAAGMGAAVVRYEQEQLMAVAWEQLAAHERDEQARRREELSLEVGQALTERHIAPLNTDRLAQVAAPINAAVLRSSAVSKNGQGDTGVGRTSTARTRSVAFRRLRRRVLGAAILMVPSARVDGPGREATVERDSRREALLAALGPATSTLPETTPTQKTSGAPTPAAGQVPNEAEVPVRFAPVFGRPMYEALHGHFPDVLLPGMEHLPPDTIALLEPNAGFVEAFMVGLNHEMSRELLWREYPVDRQGTFFRHFWDTRSLRIETGGTSPGDNGDIPPIADWAPTSPLGKNSVGVGSETAKLFVLLVRSELFRRYPRALIYAAEARWVEGAEGQREPLQGLEHERHAQFRATCAPDITLLGFSFASEQELRGADNPNSGPAGWYFVIQEQPTELRFGLDEAAGYGEVAPKDWSNLTWGHLATSAEALKDLAYVPLTGALRGTEEPDKWSVPWGKNGAHMAHITLQRSFRINIHGRVWM